MVDAIVYIVDDDPAMQALLTARLGSAGLRTAAFHSASAFLDQYDNGPGCLLLDMQLPGMSGLDLQKRMAERGIELPIVILTGTVDVTTAVAAMRGGAMD